MNEWVTRVNFGCNYFQLTLNHIWDKVFKNGPSKISGRQPLKNLKGYGLLKQAIRCKFFIGCHAQISLGPFSNTLSQSILLILKNQNPFCPTSTNFGYSSFPNIFCVTLFVPTLFISMGVLLRHYLKLNKQSREGWSNKTSLFSPS